MKCSPFTSLAGLPQENFPRLLNFLASILDILFDDENIILIHYSSGDTPRDKDIIIFRQLPMLVIAWRDLNKLRSVDVSVAIL